MPMPQEYDESSPSSAASPSGDSSSSSLSSPSASSAASASAVEDREYSAGEYEAALQALLAAYANSNQSDEEMPSAVRTPPDWPPSRGLLEQLLMPQSTAGSQPDVSSLLGVLLSNQGGQGGGGGSPLAALLQRTTTTTTPRPTRIFDRFVIKEGNPFATMRPKKTKKTTTAAITKKTTPKPASTSSQDTEVDKFDNGFQIFSQMFGGGSNALPSLNAGGPFADLATTVTTPAPPITQLTTAAPSAATTAPQFSWPFYTKPTKRTTSRPVPDDYNNNYVDKVDLNPVRPTNVPFYYNIYQTAAPPAPEPQINLGALLGGITRIVKSDGPSMLAAMSDAVTYVREGNIMGLLQGVVPVFSRATPVFMSMIQAVAPAIEKSDFYSGPEVSGPFKTGGGLGGIFNTVTGFLTGRRRPNRPFRRPNNKQGGGGFSSIFSRPYYLGQVMGSGLKLVTYLINHGTTVVRARRPDDSKDDSDGSWLQDAVGEDNAEYLRQWLNERQARARNGRS